ncbi:uncharacterized protein LOC124312218 [Daphnia pulicaria]|uniref:uncharacterized protein LOC124312218 n=1 Tax=Daphnia pulicaria TaxID=35523 RepID=UPI001EEB5C3E|nr:uncharacterized protein LOC124312218 [Daphnia pulicaria]
MDGGSQVLEEEAIDEAILRLAALKSRRSTLRRQITMTNRQIKSLISVRGSRRALRGCLRHVEELLLESTRLHSEILSIEDNDAEAERQDSNHLGYITRSSDLAIAAQVYLNSRDGDAESVIGQNIIPNPAPVIPAPVIPAPVIDPVEAQRRERARQEEVANALMRAEQARERMDRAWEEADEAQNALRSLGIENPRRNQLPEEDRFTSVSQRPITPAEDGSEQQRRMNINNNQENPDTWIDLYSAGLLPPVVATHSTRSSVSAELESFEGKALEWFSWIDLFRALVHDTPKSAGEKLALLKRYLRGDCLDLVYGLGGGEPAYIEALVRLKQTCGRRDVMRAAHHQAIGKLEPKQDPGSFKRFAERIRTHLFDLSRIGETGTTDLIEKICLKLQLHDRLAWNEGRRGRIEDRSLNDFGMWLCSRASAYQNAFSIAADQVNPNSSKLSNQKRQARTNQSSTKSFDGQKKEFSRFNGKPFCFKCEKEHRLVDCEDFKSLSVGERLTFCMRRRLCFYCFSTKYSVRECDRRKICKHAGCGFYHHQLLHSSTKEGSPSEKESEEKARPTTARTGAPQRVAMGMLRLPVMAEDGSWVLANIFIDEGSDTTLMRSAFAKVLKLRGPPQFLTVDGAGGVITRHRSSRIQFRVQAADGDILSLEGSTMKKVASPTPVTDWNKEKVQWPHLASLPLGETGGGVDILVGLDHAHLVAVIESRVGLEKEPIASKTAFGWIVRGVVEGRVNVTSVRSCKISGSASLANLATEMRRFCDTEDYGTEHQIGCVSPENKRALEIVQEKTKRLEVGYEVPIIWREGEPNLDSNRPMAENRFRSLLNRFRRQPEFERDYQAAVQKYLDQGYASRVPDPASALYFLAHHGVYKGTKLRVVYDAAAAFKGKCLNDAIISGPALQPSLAAVIIRFREGEIAWASDIEAMFSRFRLSSEDRNYFCFLWQEKDAAELIVCRMDRLPFGVNCSPFVAIYTVRRILEDAGVPESVIQAVKERMYVDDYLGSAPSVNEAVEEAVTVKDALANSDLNLQSWISNSIDFLRAVSRTEPEPDSISAHPLTGENTEKVLGIVWDPKADLLGFKVDKMLDSSFSRVDLVSKVASVFDPLGTASPFIVKAKIRLRILGLKGLGWTDLITGDDEIWWRKWFLSLEQLNTMKMPRCLFPDRAQISTVDLHAFGDASEEAYAAVIYLRVVYSDGRILVRQVKAANKIAPKKTISVPKLELNAALLAARLLRTVHSILEPMIQRRFLWTDSSTVRNWIRATAAYYQVFVSYRVGEIQTITEPEEWRFIPGVLNPADLATRSSIDEQPIPSMWLDGPEFLLQSEDSWPVDLPWMAVTEEMRSCRSYSAAVKKDPGDWKEIQIGSGDIPALSKLDEKYQELVKACQSEVYEKELHRLKKGKPLHSTSSLLALAPVLGPDGVLRLGGRAGRAKLPYDQLHPPLLPGSHPFTEKIIIAFHEHLKHVGTDFLLSYIRQHFWITSGREAIKRIRRNCVICRRNRAQPGEQLMGDLPDSRLDSGFLPFTRTAIDLFGPFEVGLIRNRTAKRWGVLFTCMVTRAVFLELVPSLSTSDFLLALRKFISLYRKPEVIHSDNGTNFVGAERVLREAVEKMYADEAIPKFLKEVNIKWTFQPARTPHFGGTHESLVRSTKRALYNALEQEGDKFRYPTEDLFRTLLYEVAGLLNTRPLTYASSDPEDFRPLTPNDFLNRPPTSYPPAGSFDDASPREHYRYLQRVLNLFWSMWKTTYLQSLAARKKWKIKRPNLEVGDVVLEINKNFRRGEWSIGHVAKVFPGTDGCVRAVDIQLPTGIFRRGITELCLLESSSSVQPDSGENESAKSVLLQSGNV